MIVAEDIKRSDSREGQGESPVETPAVAPSEKATSHNKTYVNCGSGVSERRTPHEQSRALETEAQPETVKRHLNPRFTSEISKLKLSSFSSERPITDYYRHMKGAWERRRIRAVFYAVRKAVELGLPELESELLFDKPPFDSDEARIALRFLTVLPEEWLDEDGREVRRWALAELQRREGAKVRPLRKVNHARHDKNHRAVAASDDARRRRR